MFSSRWRSSTSFWFVLPDLLLGIFESTFHTLPPLSEGWLENFWKRKKKLCSCVFVLCSSTDSSGEIKTFGSQVTRSRIASLPAEPLQRWAAGADTTHWDLAPACPCLRSRWLPRFNAGMLYPPLPSPPRPPPPC